MAFVLNSGELFVTHFSDLANHMRMSGADVMVICPSGETTKVIEGSGYRWAEIPITRSKMNPFQELSIVSELSAVYSRHRLDLVHHVTAKAVIYGSLAARRKPSLAAVNTISGLGYAFAHPKRAVLLRALLVWMYRLSNRDSSVELIFENNDDRELFLRWGIGATARSSVVPGTGVDCKKFRPRQEQSGTPVFAFIGRFLRDKGIKEFLEAARVLRGRNVQLRVVVIGRVDAGNPSSLSTSEVANKCKESGVEMWGWCSDIADVLGQVHVVVLPSWREGFPRVLQEAAAAGLPAIATDVPGCRCAIEHEVNGLLIPVREPSALADAMTRLAIDRNARISMGVQNRQRALQSYSAPEVWMRIIAAYERALLRANGRREQE